MDCNHDDILSQRYVGTRGEVAALIVETKLAREIAKRRYCVEATEDLVRLALRSNYLLGCGPGGEKDFDPVAFLGWVESNPERFGHLTQRAPDAPPAQPRVQRLSDAEISKLSPHAKLTYANRIMAEDAEDKHQS